MNLKSVEIFVLDEADRMLDMGFIHDIRRIVAALPRKRQTVLFSATLPPEIVTLAKGILCNPVRVAVTPSATPVAAIEQSVCFVEKPEKLALLVHLLLEKEITKALVFTRTKFGADSGRGAIQCPSTLMRADVARNQDARSPEGAWAMNQGQAP